jgi:uncharacterized protein YdaU (DUF1376 family)
MGTLKWYKRDPRAALIGMMGLTLEECGAYNKILDLIYISDGTLRDDPHEICRILNCNVRAWTKIKHRLLELGKLYVREGCLCNERADQEVRESKIRWLNAIKMNDKKWATYREIKGLGDRKGLLSTTTKKESLSARIVPMAKWPPDKKA